MPENAPVLVSTALPSDVVAALAQLGVEPTTTLRDDLIGGVVCDGASHETAGQHKKAFRRLRGKQLPVFTAAWVRACVARGERLSLEAALVEEQRQRKAATAPPPLVAYDPHCLRSHVITTTQLSAHVRHNVRDAVRFYGGIFDDALRSDTTVVIAAHSGCLSAKVAAARRHGAKVAPLSWLQHVIATGRVAELSEMSQQAVDVAVAMMGECFTTAPPAKQHRPEGVEAAPTAASPASAAGRDVETPAASRSRPLRASATPGVAGVATPTGGVPARSGLGDGVAHDFVVHCNTPLPSLTGSAADDGFEALSAMARYTIVQTSCTRSSRSSAGSRSPPMRDALEEVRRTLLADE